MKTARAQNIISTRGIKLLVSRYVRYSPVYDRRTAGRTESVKRYFSIEPQRLDAEIRMI